jgi:hypothetical protein
VSLVLYSNAAFINFHKTRFPNSTGAYELDLTLTQQFDKAWREMHLVSDVFCAGSVILPDKAGRQINVGGWSLESTYGVRLYTPDGSDGVNGTNDWEEDYQTLKLQVFFHQWCDHAVTQVLIFTLPARPLVSYCCHDVERLNPCYRWRDWQ